MILGGAGLSWADGGALTSGNVTVGMADWGVIPIPCGGAGQPACFANYDCDCDGVPDGATCRGTSHIGVYISPTGDGLDPGNPDEAWGIQVDRAQGLGKPVARGWVTAIDTGGPSATNLTLNSFTKTSDVLTSTTSVTNRSYISVVHELIESPEASGTLFQLAVTITNTDTTTHRIEYRRTIDWDAVPSAFDEAITITGWPQTNLLNWSDDGFNDGNMSIALLDFQTCGTGADFTDCGTSPSDHGMGFDFDCGVIDAGATVTFVFFYGAATTEALAVTALSNANAAVTGFAQNHCDANGQNLGTPATFIFGIRNDTGNICQATPSVPEEGAWGWTHRH